MNLGWASPLGSSLQRGLRGRLLAPSVYRERCDRRSLPNICGWTLLATERVSPSQVSLDLELHKVLGWKEATPTPSWMSTARWCQSLEATVKRQAVSLVSQGACILGNSKIPGPLVLGMRTGGNLGPWIQFHPDHWRERRSFENKNVWEPWGTAHLPEETPPPISPCNWWCHKRRRGGRCLQKQN